MTAAAPQLLETPAVTNREVGGPRHLARATAVVFLREVRRFTRQPIRIYGTVLGPLLIFASFGIGLGHVLSGMMTTDFQYTSYLLPGMAGMAVIIPTFGSAATIVQDREIGYLRDVFVAPVNRLAIVVGKTLAGAAVGLFQGMIVLLLTPLVGIGLTPLAVLQLVVATGLFSLAICAGAVFVASRITRIENYIQLQNLVMNPLFFFSGATFPLDDLPLWLNIVTRFNPMTYAIDAMRRSLPDAQQGIPPVTVFGASVPVAVELLFVAAFAVVAMFAAALQFRRMT